MRDLLNRQCLRKFKKRQGGKRGLGYEKKVENEELNQSLIFLGKETKAKTTTRIKEMN